MSECQILSEEYLKEERVRASDRCAFALQQDTDIQIDVSLFKHIKVHHYIDEPELHLKSKTSGSHLDISKFVSSNLFQGVCLARGLNAAQFLDNEETIEELPDFTNEIAIMEGKDLQKQKQMKIMRQRNLMLQLKIREERNKKRQILKKMSSDNNNRKNSHDNGRQIAQIKFDGSDKNTINSSIQNQKGINHSNFVNMNKNINNNNNVSSNQNNNNLNDNIISISGMLDYLNQGIEKQPTQFDIDSNMIQINHVSTLNSKNIHKITNLTSNPNLLPNRQIQSSMSTNNNQDTKNTRATVVTVPATASGKSISKSSNRTYTENDEGSRQKTWKKGQELTKRSYSLGNPEEYMMFGRDFERNNTSGKMRHIETVDKQQTEQESNGKLAKTLELQNGDILAEGSYEFSSEKDRQTQSVLGKGTPSLKDHERSQKCFSEQNSMKKISSSKTHCIAVAEEVDNSQKQNISRQQEQDEHNDNDKEEITDWKEWDWHSQALAKRFAGVKDSSIWKMNQQQRKKDFYLFNSSKVRDKDMSQFDDLLSKKRQHHMKKKLSSNESNLPIQPAKHETNASNVSLQLQQKQMASGNQLLLPLLPPSANINNKELFKSPLGVDAGVMLPTIVDKANSRSSSFSSRSNYLSNRSSNNSQTQQRPIKMLTEQNDTVKINENERKQINIRQSSPTNSEVQRQSIKKNRQVQQKEIVKVTNNSEKSESLSVERTIEQPNNELDNMIPQSKEIEIAHQEQQSQQYLNLYNQPKEMKEWFEGQIIDQSMSQVWSRKQSLIKNPEEQSHSKQNNYSSCQSACASSSQRREDTTRNASVAESRNYSVHERDNYKNSTRHRRVLSEASERSIHTNDMSSNHYQKKELSDVQIHNKNDALINGIQRITRKDIELKRALKQQVILSPIDQLIVKAKKIQSKYEQSVNHVQKIIDSSNSSCVENIKNKQYHLLKSIQQSYHNTPLGNLKMNFNLILDRVQKA